ncbi:transcriptional regulator [Bacillus phage CM1]|nr:transcriptional regulator [Bacillus phage CM1]
MTVTTINNTNTKGGIVTMVAKKKTTKKKTPKMLKKFRMDEGHTIYSLADKLGVDYTTVSNWENGNKYPRPNKITELEDLFGVSYRELFEDLPEDQIAELERRRYNKN